MSKDAGSLGYQMMKVLQTLFHPGTSRRQAKRHHRERGLITSISTMRSMSANVHQFARFICTTWPDIRLLKQVTQEMALAYIRELERREDSGGTIGRVCAAIRMLDIGCRKNRIFPEDAPTLLPYRVQGGPGPFHAQTRTNAYSPEQAAQLITWIAPKDPVVAQMLSVMLSSGLRVSEATYLRAQDIHLESKTISLNATSNANHTKGGRPRTVKYLPIGDALLAELKAQGEKDPTDHLFNDRHALPDRAREMVRQGCRELGIPLLGTHAFRKRFAQDWYQALRQMGLTDLQALLETARQLGHNRSAVSGQSYVSPSVRNVKGVDHAGRYGSEDH